MKAASLNHIYRLVWSRLQQAWVAVAETARAQGKSSVSGKVPEPASGYVGKRHIGATPLLPNVACLSQVHLLRSSLH